MKYKEALEEVLANLRCIDVTDNEQVKSYVDDSIRVIKEALEDNKDTAQEVPVQEQSINDDLLNAISEKIVTKIASALKNC